MAFLSKVGNILRQTVSKRVSSEVSPFKVSAFQALSLRCMCYMSNSKVFVGGISYQTDEQSLREAFAKYGQVVDARIIMDRDTGRSRGFGFVTFTSSEEASSAIQALDGQDLHGRRVRVNYASDRRAAGGGGGYGGSGGYGGGGGGYGGGGGGGYGGGDGYSGGGGNYGGSGGNYNSNYGGSYGNAPAQGGDFGGYGNAAGGDSFTGGYDGGAAGQGLASADGFADSSPTDNSFGNNTADEPREASVRDDDDTDFAKRA